MGNDEARGALPTGENAGEPLAAVAAVEEVGIGNAAEGVAPGAVPGGALVRPNIIEKMDREQVVGQVVQVRQELTSLINDLRADVGRLRTDLMDDQQRGVDLLREDASKSLKKNEELIKLFVLHLGGQSAPPTKSPRARDDGAPMRVPG